MRTPDARCGGAWRLRRYAELLIDPAVEGGMTSASGSCRSPYGTARSDWARTWDRFRPTVDVPAGSTAQVHVPAAGGRAEAGGSAAARGERTGGRVPGGFGTPDLPLGPAAVLRHERSRRATVRHVVAEAPTDEDLAVPGAATAGMPLVGGAAGPVGRFRQAGRRHAFSAV
ncbi:alpha-L-rhamnosidase C-terminal domain-containing protein [Streptomyces sp. NPDC014986]|uniref:alpha-L-rhamnosidase C-terminal domain-containing protein n=1 Tax=Streptomyces sp. NPDC014986 TaxID=3364934 RepID=UPI0036FFA89E